MTNESTSILHDKLINIIHVIFHAANLMVGMGKFFNVHKNPTRISLDMFLNAP